MKRTALMLILMLCMMFCGTVASASGYLFDVQIGIPMEDALESLKNSTGKPFHRMNNQYVKDEIYTADNIVICDLPFQGVASCDGIGDFWNLSMEYHDFFESPVRTLSLFEPYLFSKFDRILDFLTKQFGSPISSRWTFGSKYPNPNFDIPFSENTIDFERVLEVSEKHPGTVQFYWDHVYLSFYFSESTNGKTYASCHINSSSVDRPQFDSCGAYSEDVLLSKSPVKKTDDNDEYTSIRGGLTFASSFEDVKAYEGKPDSVSSGVVSYFDISVVHRKAEAHYTFDSKENINSLAIFFNQPHSEYGKYLDDYDAVSDALTEKYGNPLISDVEWSSSLFQDSEDMHGTALAMGYLKKYAMWVFKDGTIYHSISGDNFEIDHSILYSSNLSTPSSKPVDLGI